jgi:DNA primase
LRRGAETGGAGSAADLVDRIADERLQTLAARLAIGEDPWDRMGCGRLLDQYEASRRRRQDPMLPEIKAAEAAGDEQLLMRLLHDRQERLTGNQ